MTFWDKKSIWSFTILLAAAVSQKVTYPNPVCAVRGSTVTLPCTFTPLRSVKLKTGEEVLTEIVRVVWCQNHPICQLHTPSVYDSNSTTNNPRYKYLGDLKGNCTLQITDINKSDDATFRFRMEANDVGGHFTERSGIKVTVTDPFRMKITSSADSQLRGGDRVTLRCTALCSVHSLKITWSKDGLALSESGPTLQLGPLTAKDSGNYTCGLKTRSGTLSEPYSLQVEADEGEADHSLLMLGVVFGVLLVLLTLVLVVCIIRRKRAAAAEEQKPLDNIYSNILSCAEQGAGQQEETGHTVEDISYASVQFKHKRQARVAEEAEDAIIYSSVASATTG